MHEVLGQLGHVVVDHVRDVLHVDAACRNVSGHQNAMPAFSEAAQSGVPLRLRAVAVNLRGCVARAAQAVGKPVGSMLGAHEDEEAALLVLPQQMLEQFLLVVLRDFKGAQVDAGGGL